MNVREAVEKRFSNRYFNDQEISKEDVTTILDAGRLAPNGFGWEAWNFHYTQQKQQEFMSACYGQTFVGDSGLVVVLTSPTLDYIKGNRDYMIDKGIANFGSEDKALKTYEMMINMDATKYFSEQTFIAASQMVLQATALGIGSTMIGGFEEQKIADLLGIRTEEHRVNLVIAFGHSDHPQPNRSKKPLAEVAINLDK